MTTKFREVCLFPPAGPYDPETSGFCLACGAINVGGIARGVHHQRCAECGEDYVVGMSDSYLRTCVDLVDVEPEANGRPIA